MREEKDKATTVEIRGTEYIEKEHVREMLDRVYERGLQEGRREGPHNTDATLVRRGEGEPLEDKLARLPEYTEIHYQPLDVAAPEDSKMVYWLKHPRTEITVYREDPGEAADLFVWATREDLEGDG